MSVLTFQKQTVWIWVKLGWLAVMTAAVFGIWLGPKWMALAASAGWALAGAGLLASLINPMKYPSVWQAISLAFANTVVLIVSFVLWAYFLKPLSGDSLNVPRFSHRYVDPNGRFELRGPEGWDYTEVISPTESGVTITPATKTDYVGVYELKVMVRKLEKAPASTEKFLETMADTLSKPRGREAPKKYFEFSTQTVPLMDGKPGVRSNLEMKKLWIPLRQVTVFGIKKNRYLCSASGAGLKSHSILSEVLCKGLVQSLQVRPEK